MGKTLVIAGLALVVLGVLWMLGEHLGLGRLPGDIAVERGNTRFYFPLTTSIVLSIVASFVLWLIRR